jgi:xanthine dehydrogenase YagR molybdenum-binding subunit
MNLSYDPKKLEVRAGDSVVWTNKARTEHTATSDDEGKTFDTGEIEPGQSYAVPVHADAPEIEAHFIDKPDPHINTLGCRGIGELSITGAAAAIANSVHHATGKRVRDLPVTPDKLLV